MFPTCGGIQVMVRLFPSNSRWLRVKYKQVTYRDNSSDSGE